MDFINLVLTFPGKIIAYSLKDYLWLVSSGLFVLMGLSLAAAFISKRREHLKILFILTSIFLAFVPAVFKFAHFESVLFWVFLFLSASIGFLYYFLFNKSDEWGIPASEEGSGETLTSGSPAVPFSFNNPLSYHSAFYRNRYTVLLLLILCLAFYMRSFQMEKYPAGYSWWELQTVYELIQYDKGVLDLKFYFSLFKMPQVNESNLSPILIGTAYPFFKIFGISLLSSRLYILVWGMAGLIFLYLYLREYFEKEPAIFMSLFVCLELSNVIFSRTGFQFIIPFTYAFFILFLLEKTFKERRRVRSWLMAGVFGVVLFGSNYLYIPAKTIMAFVSLIFLYRVFFRKGYLKEKLIPLGVFTVVFSGLLIWYTDGNLRMLWPIRADYVRPENGSLAAFLNDIFGTWGKNFHRTFNIIALEDRARHSESLFKGGGLISGPVISLIPFAIGYLLAGIRKEFHFTMFVMIGFATLPGMLGVANSRRLLLAISFMLILPGITAYLLFEQIRKIFPSKHREMVYYLPAASVIFLFSFNLFVFIDVNKNMTKLHMENIPFADSGFGDMNYAHDITALAKEIREYIKTDNVYYYFSDMYMENGTSPAGSYEQFLIDSYENSKTGGELVWMNPFNYGVQNSVRYRTRDQLYFKKFEAALNMILNSDRGVRVIFIRSFADEVAIYDKLKAFFPEAKAEEKIGFNGIDKIRILSIPLSEIEDVKSGRNDLFITNSFEIFTNEMLSDLIKENINSNFRFERYFLLENDSQFLAKNNFHDVLEVMIDDEKITDVTKTLLLSKGSHRITVKFLDKVPVVILNAGGGAPRDFSVPFISKAQAQHIESRQGTVRADRIWALEKSIPYTKIKPPHSFHIQSDKEIYYSTYGALFDKEEKNLDPTDHRLISKILKIKNDLFVLRYFLSLQNGYLVVYDSGFKKVREFDFPSFPFDVFQGKDGTIFVTHLNQDKISIVGSDFNVETWETRSFSKYPIWNGAVGENGEIILLSAGGELFVFDENRKDYIKFPVDASWITNPEVTKYGGGVVFAGGGIHVLDSAENSINSYTLTGDKLIGNVFSSSLFKIPGEFKIDFMQELNGKIYLAGHGPGRRILQYQPVKNQPRDPDKKSSSLLDLKPVEADVGWGNLGINSAPGMTGEINGSPYVNYIFAHAPSLVSYDVKGLFKTLSFSFGLDDIGGKDPGTVRFIVKGDGRELFSSEVIRAQANMKKYEIEISGVKKLELIADPTEDGNPSDEAVWVDPVLYYR